MRPASILIAILGILVGVSGIVWLVLYATKLLAPPIFALAAEAAWSFLLFSVAVGGLTMAFVQTCRVLIPIRGIFHRQQLQNLISRNVKEGEPLGPDSRPFDPDRALAEFEQRDRDTPSDSLINDLYDLPLEQLCGQLTVTIDNALERPASFRQFLIGITGRRGLSYILDLEILSSSGALSTEGAPEALRYAQARGALMRLAQRRIDAFQIATGSRWRRILRGAAVLISICASLLISMGATDTFAFLKHGAYAILAGVLAGFLAMLLRDLTAIVELKRRP